MDLFFNLEVNQERVREWKSYFKTETTKEEFHDEFKKSFSKKLLDAFNKEISKGIRIPYAHT